MRDETFLQDEEVLPTPEPVAGIEREIDVREVLRVLRRSRRQLLAWSLLAGIAAAGVSLVLSPTYTAVATFLPPNSMSSGASALLGQLGALGGAGGALGGLKDPSLVYVGMLRSRTVADALIHEFDLGTVYKTSKLSQTEKALTGHSSFVSGKDSIVTVSVDDHDPKRAAAMANAYLAQLHVQNDRIAFTEAGQKRLFYEGQLEKEKNVLADAEVDLKRSQEKSGLILPGGQAGLEIETITQTQAQIASREVELEAMSQAETAQNPDVVRLRSEIGGLRGQLARLESSNGSGGAGNVQVPTAKVPELTLEYVRKQREVKYHEALYELLLKQYASAKLDESRSAPLIQVMDYAVVPDSKSGPHRLLMTLEGLFLGAGLGAAVVLWRSRALLHEQGVSMQSV